MTYLESCTKYFAPIDEIIEALANNEGLSGMTNKELVMVVTANKSLMSDICEFKKSF